MNKDTSRRSWLDSTVVVVLMAVWVATSVVTVGLQGIVTA